MLGILSGFKQYLYLGVLAAFLAVCATAGFYKWKSDKQLAKVIVAEQQVKDAKAETQITQQALVASKLELEASRIAIELRDQKLAVLKQQKEASDAKLHQALKANPTWSNAPLPASVRDILH